MPLSPPDGLRTVGPQTLIQAEGQGRLTERTIKENRAEVRVLQEGLTAATGVTVVGTRPVSSSNAPRPLPCRIARSKRVSRKPARSDGPIQ
jgi:hypothetical protein